MYVCTCVQCRHLQCVYVCTCILQTGMYMFVCTCVCPGPEAMSQDSDSPQVGVLAPWPLGGGASMDTLMLGTCRVTVRLSWPEEGHRLLL